MPFDTPTWVCLAAIACLLNRRAQQRSAIAKRRRHTGPAHLRDRLHAMRMMDALPK